MSFKKEIVFPIEENRYGNYIGFVVSRWHRLYCVLSSRISQNT